MVACDYTRNAVVPQLYSDLAGLEFALSLIDYAPCVRLFGQDPPPGLKRGPGRPRYPRIPLVKAFLAAYIVGALGRQDTVDKLNSDPALRRSCGWPVGLNPHPPETQKGNGKVGQTNATEVGYMGQAIEDENTHQIFLKNRHRGYKYEL